MTPNYFADCSSPQEAKLVYRAHAVRLHPDTPGGNEAAFKELVAQYERAIGKTVDYDTFVDDEEWESTSNLDESLVSPNSPVKLYCNFGSGWLTLQTLDCKVCFSVAMHTEMERYEKLKERSATYSNFRGNTSGRLITLKACEFADLWALYQSQKKPAKKLSGVRNAKKCRGYVSGVAGIGLDSLNGQPQP